jgi:TM2 domain-containing membrane protein YozV
MTKQTKPVKSFTWKNNHWLAALLSIIPGIGQIYKNHTKRGLAIFAITIISAYITGRGAIVLWFWNIWDAYRLDNGQKGPAKYSKYVLVASLIIAVIISFLQVMDYYSFNQTVQAATDLACRQLISGGGCDYADASFQIPISDLDANIDDTLNPDSDTFSEGMTNGDFDNLGTLCINYYGADTTNESAFISSCNIQVCGC